MLLSWNLGKLLLKWHQGLKHINYSPLVHLRQFLNYCYWGFIGFAQFFSRVLRNVFFVPIMIWKKMKDYFKVVGTRAECCSEGLVLFKSGWLEVCGAGIVWYRSCTGCAVSECLNRYHIVVRLDKNRWVKHPKIRFSKNLSLSKT